MIPSEDTEEHFALNGCIPTPVQISQVERVALCNDIQRFSLLLGREAGREEEKLPASSVAASDLPSPWERLHRLAALRSRLESTLHGIAACPDSASVPEPRSLPIYAVRGKPATQSRLARRPTDQRAWLQATHPDSCETSSHLEETRTVPTLRTPSNRIAAEYLMELAQELHALHRLALFCEESEAAITAEGLLQSVRGWLRRSPFRESVSTPDRGRPYAEEALWRSAPAYRSLYRLIRTTRSGLHIDWSESAVLRFPALEAWHLYEIWCFLRVGVALRALGWRPVENDCLPIAPTGMRLRLAHGQASRIRFRAPDSASAADNLDLFYQPLFASANRAPGTPTRGYRSLSHVMQPDIALERDGRLLLLDPKYRSYTEPGDEQEDVDKMHAYRDAIVRVDVVSGNTVPAVDAAWCLFPGTPSLPLSPPEPLRAYPAPTQEHPFGRAGVGALRLRPLAADRELIGLLLHWLTSGERGRPTSE